MSLGYGAIGALRKRGAALAAALMLALPAQADPVTVTAMGDSLVQGYGLDNREGFVPVLEDWLRARDHDVNVINAGVSGDTTAGGKARIDWTLGDSPDALIVVFGGNDLLRGIDPAESRANLDAILGTARAEEVPVLLAGIPAPGNYGPDYRDAFAAMYPELAEEHAALLFPDFLAPISERAMSGQPHAHLMQGDNLHPNAEGVRRIVEGIGPAVEELLARAE